MRTFLSEWWVWATQMQLGKMERSLRNFDQLKAQWQPPWRLEAVSRVVEFHLHPICRRQRQKGIQTTRRALEFHSLSISRRRAEFHRRYGKEKMWQILIATDFEFCVNGRKSILGETHQATAGELFVDGKMLPLIHGPVEAQPVTTGHLVSLESLRCLSPVRLTSSPPSKIRSSCWGNAAPKSSGYKRPNKWKEMLFKLRKKEMLFKLRKKENVCAENKRTSCKVVDQSQPSSANFLWSFSSSCRRDGDMKGNSLFRSLPFSRSQSTAERKLKGATSGCPSTEIEIDVSGVFEGSKPLEALSISNKVQPEPHCYTELKQGKANGEANGKQYTAGRGQLSSSGLPASRMRKGMGGQRSIGRVSRNGRLMVRKFDSPPPGKPTVVKADNSMGGVRVRVRVRVSPVLNVGGSWNGGGGLLGFFSKRERKQQQSPAYLHTDRK